MTSERSELEALAAQWDRDADGCDRDGYRDAGIVKRDCARRLRELVRRLQPGNAEAAYRLLQDVRDHCIRVEGMWPDLWHRAVSGRK